jgi:hypothetical protein
MRKLSAALFLSLVIIFAQCAVTGCKTSPTERTQTVTTLKIVGTSAKASIDAAASLLRDGKISVSQWQSISSVYDTKFQPAFNLAAATAHSDLSSAASPDLIALASQLATLIAQFTTKPV